MSGINLQTDVQSSKLKVNNGFVVTDFIVKTDINFVYSKTEAGYKLLNLDTLGVIEEQSIVDLIDAGASVAIIEKLDMYVYNLDEDVLKQAMISL